MSDFSVANRAIEISLIMPGKNYALKFTKQYFEKKAEKYAGCKSLYWQLCTAHVNETWHTYLVTFACYP